MERRRRAAGTERHDTVSTPCARSAPTTVRPPARSRSRVDDGRIVEVAGDRAHPFTQGVICGKVHDYAERVYSPLRVLRPLRRVGPKGAGEFEPITWDEAIEEIARRCTRIIAQ